MTSTTPTEHIRQKIVEPSFFEKHRPMLQNKKTVFTNGCFDVLHYGHVACLAKARQLGDLLIVGLNSDSSVRRLKGPSRPVNGQMARAIVLAALEMVDYVVLFDEDTPSRLITDVKPNVLAKGGDYTPENIAGADFVKSNGGEVVIIPLEAGFSSTHVINKLNL